MMKRKNELIPKKNGNRTKKEMIPLLIIYSQECLKVL